MRLEELMQTLNYAKKGRGRDFLIQERMKKIDPMNLQNMATLDKNKTLPFVDRVLKPEEYPTPSLFDEDRMQTHVMGAEQDEDTGEWFVFPSVIFKDGKYTKFNDNRKAMRFAKKTGNIIPFGKGENAKQKALNFSINYKPENFKEHYKGVQKEMGGLLN
tara:strand:- start:250 stop:729 length:480 start_codon:yes stop_codon:yes gene_type:complete